MSSGKKLFVKAINELNICFKKTIGSVFEGLHIYNPVVGPISRKISWCLLPHLDILSYHSIANEFCLYLMAV